MKIKLHTFSTVLFIFLTLITSLPRQAKCGDFPVEVKIGGFAIGPQAWSFNRFTFYEAVDKAKEAGCNVIEVYPGQKLSPADSIQFNHEAPPSVWVKAKLKLEAAGVRIVNYGVTRFANEQEAHKVFGFAKLLDIPAITIEPDDNSPEMFRLVEKMVKEYNIKVGFHNHPQRPDNPDYKWWNPDFIFENVKDLDPRVGLAADTGHWIRSGINPLESLKKAEGRIISVHLKDLKEYDPQTHDVPYGTGVANIGLLLDELKRQGFDGNIAIEYEYNWENNLPDIKQCIDFVREYGKINP
ncbi:sugar phosphate isomerase/epimerase [candidate division KSB1 bacterium]|nr:sugar phosphate isomerase/epimerase [candidate division KSB1 bacterium]